MEKAVAIKKVEAPIDGGNKASLPPRPTQKKLFKIPEIKEQKAEEIPKLIAVKKEAPKAVMEKPVKAVKLEK